MLYNDIFMGKWILIAVNLDIIDKQIHANQYLDRTKEMWLNSRPPVDKYSSKSKYRYLIKFYSILPQTTSSFENETISFQYCYVCIFLCREQVKKFRVRGKSV